MAELIKLHIRCQNPSGMGKRQGMRCDLILGSVHHVGLGSSSTFVCGSCSGLTSATAVAGGTEVAFLGIPKKAG